MIESGPSSSDARDLEIGRILCDIHDRRARGEIVPDEDVIAAHPELADELRNHLRTLVELHTADQTIEGLIRRGWLIPPTDVKYVAEFGPYKIIEPLGRGGMGIVLKAFDETLRRVVALKLLRPDVADDEKALARFTREARAAAALTHPNIISVFAVGEERGARYIAMEHVDGPSLAQLIRERGPLPADTIRSLFAQLLEGLAAAHNAGLIHRDVKSANLLLINDPLITNNPLAQAHGSQSVGLGTKSSSASLKIADFGLARITSSQTRLTMPEQSFGTPEYMSPEQARGDNEIDARTDLYSAGVVLYEMLTGRVPFNSDSPAAVVHQILHTAPADPRSIQPHADPALATLALRLTAKRREDRLASAAAASAVLESHRLIASREARRRRNRMGSLIGGSAALLILAVWGFAVRAVNPIIDAAPHEDRFVKVQRADGEWKKTFYMYPSGTQVSSAACADIDGRGTQRLFATLFPPHNGHILEAIDTNGNYLWGQYSTLTSTFAWPDCQPLKGWSGIQVLAAPLDDEPGDELIVVTSDVQEYPTRVSIMNPGNGEVLGTFWNLGDIGSNHTNDLCVRVLPKFFEDGAPGILIHGLNNKLDGFNDARAEKQVRWTPWDIVSVVMVLNPREIMRLKQCVGPPHTNLVRLPQGGVHAYAFVNLSSNDKASEAVGLIPSPMDQGAIHNIAVVGSFPKLHDPFIKLDFQLRTIGDADTLGAVVNLDRNLDVLNCVITPNPANPRNKAEWTALWVPVVQNSRWLEPGVFVEE